MSIIQEALRKAQTNAPAANERSAVPKKNDAKPIVYLALLAVLIPILVITYLPAHRPAHYTKTAPTAAAMGAASFSR